ncbi:alpha-D-ribose 1-methylphosphonate 5-triphosphate diphosphatase [Natrinema hispanicum]|uniref:Alpha-D-ribose 1-methylphosphonate 5-triphosphate diphosphatase n=1 Tax=Natrinema hispanicum TaxID=392421 RepID=A0A1G6VJG7_9EURY|nr:alpha-D-ribose 1-methylphosphonate 5-triphosphate diphosphatase [Natrinema hispanicum]SDD53664.1 alpha-D-ribose 1-methylphosphonate 5-triphosphate diphosphatase [Natrinema hispanicum]SET92542.1 alpha-D-ribose 1-methylphosphonate 5-triphosphate diphosphatase [Natrinema hispanicum]
MSGQRAVNESTIVVENARLVTPEAVVEGALRIEGDRIAGIGDVERRADETVDARDRLVLPGLIDLHGDDIESHLHPRSGARMDTHMALAAADRANLAAGITTKFHAISFEVDPKENRSPELGAEITDAVERADDLMADHRIHARCEVTQERCVEAVEELIAAGDADLVSVMSHIPGKGQFRNEEAFLDYYRNSQKHTIEEAQELIKERGDLELGTIRERVNRVVETAHDHGIPTASHDDEEATEVERLSNVGVDISEYPITLATAKRAHELGMTVTMGAPNLVRGGSQWGNLRTADAIDAGVVDALVADYHPTSLLAAPFVDTGDPLPERVARVTKQPADAVGLTDRGRITEGARADLVVIDENPTPTVTQALVAGTPVYRAEGSP